MYHISFRCGLNSIESQSQLIEIAIGGRLHADLLGSVFKIDE